MFIASILKEIEFNESKPAVNILLNTPATKEIRVIFRKGQVMKEHKAAYPIVVEVVRGIIDFGVGEERFQLDEGMLIALEAHVLHELKAEEDSIIRLSLNKSDNIERVEEVIQ